MDGVLVVGASGRVGRMLARAWVGMGLRPVLQHRGAGLAVDLPQVRWRPLAEPLPQGDFAAMIVLAIAAEAPTTPESGWPHDPVVFIPSLLMVVSAAHLPAGPIQMPPPVGYICMLSDPDGNRVEYSFDQGVYAAAHAKWG